MGAGATVRVNLGNQEWICLSAVKGGHIRGKRQMQGESFGDVCPVQRSLRARRSRHRENREVHFVHGLPVLSSPVVINVCGVTFVIAHTPQDEVSVDMLTFI